MSSPSQAGGGIYAHNCSQTRDTPLVKEEVLDTSDDFLIYSGVAFGGCILLVLVFVLLRRCCSRRHLIQDSSYPGRSHHHQRSRRDKSLDSSYDTIALELKDMATLPHATTEPVGVFRNPVYVSMETQLKSMEFPRTRLCFTAEKGKGTFGKIYKGEASSIKQDELTTTVYVKTLGNSHDDRIIKDFESEMMMAAQFHHPNIIQLLGVSTVEEPQCLIYECMEYGSLKEFLQHVSQGFQVKDADASSVELDQRKHMVNDQDLARMAAQVALALDYLAKHNFVHSDVAARNCQVGSCLKVKLSEFGLNKDINSQDYYHVGTKLDILLPVRWMSPEAIKQRIFTVQNDIWSFGVLMWEMFTFGRRPYGGKTNSEAISAILKQQHLPYPDDCPIEMYKLMLECWNINQYKRPRYTDLYQSLESWVRALRDADDVSLSSMSSVAL